MAKYTLADVAPDQTSPAPPAPRYTLADVAPGQTGVPAPAGLDANGEGPGTAKVSPAEILDGLKSGTLGDDRVKELGGPMKAAYKVASVPAQQLTKGLKAIVDKIPDPETRSAAANFAIGIPKTLADVGADVAGSAISPESLLLMALPEEAISEPLGAAAKKMRAFAEDKFPGLAQALTGVQKKYFANIVRAPKTILPEFMGGPKALSEAGDAVESAENSAFGDAAKPTPREINDPALTTARRNALNAADDLAQAKELAKTDPDLAKEFLSNPDEGARILKGKRGTQAQLDQPSTTGSRKALLTKQLGDMSDVIGEHYPEVADALAKYGSSLTRDKVMSILPVLKSGDPSIMRMVLTGLGRTAGAPFGITMPAVNGIAAALGSLGASGLEALAKSAPDAIKGLALAEIARRKSSDDQ